MRTTGIAVSNQPTARVIPHDLPTRIRKLRWMGMEDEAKVLERELKSDPSVENDSVLAIPCNTD